MVLNCVAQNNALINYIAGSVFPKIHPNEQYMPAGEKVELHCAGDYKRRVLHDNDGQFRDNQFILRWTFNDSQILPGNVYFYYIRCALIIHQLQESNSGMYKLEFHDVLNRYILYDVAIVALSSLKHPSITYDSKSRIKIQSECDIFKSDLGAKILCHFVLYLFTLVISCSTIIKYLESE